MAFNFPAPVATKPKRWFDVRPEDGVVLPVAAPRAYYPAILYSATPAFFDGVGLRKYVAYYGAGLVPTFGGLAFSDDGVTWDHELDLVGVLGEAYHVAAILVAGVIHFFYWDTTASLYSPAAVRHATMNPAVSCAVAVTDAALTGNYTGTGPGNLRYGSYGFNQVFFNPAPTSNPANPYSYPWCAIHEGTDGGAEGVLFATSNDGYAWASWNGLTEVIPRGAGLWDAWVGTMFMWQDSAGLRHAFYAGGLGTGGGEDSNFAGGIGYATSLDGITWVKWTGNPIMRKTESLKSWKRLYTPQVIMNAAGDYQLFFTTKSQAGLYRVAIAKMAGFV